MIAEKKPPHMKRPCGDCPFRRDTPPGWLGEARAREILSVSSFVCHKDHAMQCAGHMLLKGEHNAFVQIAQRLGIQLDLSGHEVVFEDASSWIAHHSAPFVQPPR